MSILNLFSIIFTLGGIIGFVSMLFHSVYTNDDLSETGFIFGCGTLLAYLLEFTLVHHFGAYTYTNLPVTLFAIPLVIPLGWVVTFYGLMHISNDLITLIIDSENTDVIKEFPVSIIMITGLLAILFGLSIEVLARTSEFWEFHFVSLEFFGIPIIVSLAWGLSVSTFTTGVILFRKYRKYWWLQIIAIQVVNTMIAFILLQFVSISN